MTRLLLIRHAKPAANWDVSDDAGLDPTGHAQAAALPAALATRGPLPIVTSPLRRTRETAAPLAEAWSKELAVDPTVGEIASPGVTMQERSSWLRVVMAAQWGDLDASLQSWRESLLATLRALSTDTVVVTHFVAINTVVGACTGDARVLSFSPAHTSITEIEVAGGALHLVERGAEATSAIL
jgi:broad specificity phosphatase PhoE